MKYAPIFLLPAFVATLLACSDTKPGVTHSDPTAPGIRIAYVNADSILQNYKEYRVASQEMGARQRKAEEQLQVKSAELEKEIIAYQRKVQAGTLSRNEMESQERRLAGKQEALLTERDLISEELYRESAEMNDRLKNVLHQKLQEIKKAEGYDFIFSYADGGPLLVADEKYDITRRVLNELNKEMPAAPKSDTTGQ